MPFKPGQSGNPGGKPKIPKEVQTLARQYTAEAVKALTDALKNPRERVAAATELLNRGWGKPRQVIEATVRHIDPDSIPDAELATYIERDRGADTAQTQNDPPLLN